MLTRRITLKGVGFKPRGFASMDPERLRAKRLADRASNIDVLLAGRGRAAVMGGNTSGQPINKENASQSQAYQAAVRAIGYCMRCGCSLRKGERQFAHADFGKGTGLKTDVRRGALCCAGCHYHVGTSGRLPKQLRRAVEIYLAWKTRSTLRKLHLWPRSIEDTWAERDQSPVENPEAHHG